MLGRGNSVIRRMRRLRSDRSARDSEGVFTAEGIHLAEEALRYDAKVELAIHSPRLRDRPGGDELLRRLDQAPFPLEETSDEVIGSIQDARSPQPVVLVVRRRLRTLEAILDDAARPILVVAADGIQDPGNLGSIVRTADASGATCVVALGEHVDPFHPRTVRATAGSIFRLPVVPAGDGTGLLTTLERRRIATVATFTGARESYDRFDWNRDLALFLGREASGIAPETLSSLRHHVGIPMHGEVESLSVGAAAAVLLFEAARCRRVRTGG